MISALVAMGLTAAEAASVAGATAAATAAEGGMMAGAAGAGALGAGGGAIGAGAGSVIPAMAPAAAGAEASALPIGPMMGQGVEAFPQGPVSSAAQPSVFDKFFSGAKSMGSNMLDSATPKSTTDYLKLGQMGSQMATPSPMRPAAPPPMMRPGGSAIPLGDPQRLQSLTVGGGGGGGGLDPRTLAMLAKLLGGQR